MAARLKRSCQFIDLTLLWKWWSPRTTSQSKSWEKSWADIECINMIIPSRDRNTMKTCVKSPFQNVSNIMLKHSFLAESFSSPEVPNHFIRLYVVWLQWSNVFEVSCAALSGDCPMRTWLANFYSLAIGCAGQLSSVPFSCFPWSTPFCNFFIFFSPSLSFLLNTTFVFTIFAQSLTRVIL